MHAVHPPASGRPAWARPRLGVGRRRFLALAGAAAALAASAPPSLAASAAEADDGRTDWRVDSVPEIGAMARRVHDTLAATATRLTWRGRAVQGIAAGRLYAPIFIRDLATVQPVLPYFLPQAFSQTPIEAFLASQAYVARTPALRGAVAATLNAAGVVDKATVVSDEETSAVQAAHAYFRAFGGSDWLRSDLAGRAVIDRVGDALAYLWRERRWNQGSLLFRGHTTDWGDVKREAGPEPTDLQPGDDLTLSPFDQAWHLRALFDYAAMLDAVDRGAAADAQRARAEQVRTETNAALWQPGRGHYRVHAHVTNWVDPFDEDAVVPISNVLAVYAGLASVDQTPAIFESAERAAAAAETNRAGLTLAPAFPDGFFQSRRMAAGEYQNGAVWDWWGGLQIVSEFEHGHAERGIAHLAAASRAWEAAGSVHEWFHIPSQTSQGSGDFAGAAGTMAQAVIRGLFGVSMTTDGFRVTPRLGGRSGRLRAVRPGGGRLDVAQVVSPSHVFLDIRADTAAGGLASLRLPDEWSGAAAFVDGWPAAARVWRAGADVYAGVWRLEPGVHSIIAVRTA